MKEISFSARVKSSNLKTAEAILSPTARNAEQVRFFGFKNLFDSSAITDQVFCKHITHTRYERYGNLMKKHIR
jgi:hypothetical protein